jgi:hypothetical protein
MMVYNTQNYWVFGLCPLSRNLVILSKIKNGHVVSPPTDIHNLFLTKHTTVLQKHQHGFQKAILMSNGFADISTEYVESTGKTVIVYTVFM